MEQLPEDNQAGGQSVPAVRVGTVLVAAVVLGVFVLIAFVVLGVLARSVNAGPPTSGEGWNLVDVGSDLDRSAGEVFASDTPGGVEVTIVVDTGTGGAELCDPFEPQLNGVDTRSEVIVFDITWPRRGCSDRGPYSFRVELENMRFEGEQLAFLPSPEAVECPLVFVAPRQGVADVTSISCDEVRDR